MKNPLVLTGATGFLGAALIDVLEAEGALGGTIALTRRPAPELSARGIEVRVGDLQDAGFIAEALPAHARIVHMAGKVDFTAEGTKGMLDLHVEATRVLAAGALKAECERFVLLSSSGTTAVSRKPVEMNEDTPYPLETLSRWPYYLSKLYQERLVLDLVQREQLPAVTLNPSLLLGPGDERGGSTAVVADFLNGRIVAAPSGGIGMVDVRDVATATYRALSVGEPGERFFLGSWNTSFASFFEVLGRIADRPAPWLTAPKGFAPFGARVLERVARGRLPALAEAMAPAKMEMADHYWYVDWRKAASQLDFKPRRPEATLRDTVADMRARGVYRP